MKKRYDVFLSYKREEADIMFQVYDALLSDGISVWIDEFIEKGERIWKKAIDQAIRETRSLVVLCSKAANDSQWVHDEIAYAEALNMERKQAAEQHPGTEPERIEIVMFHIADEFSEAIPGGYRSSQVIDARDDRLPTAILDLKKTLATKLKLTTLSAAQQRIAQLEREKADLLEEVGYFKQQDDAKQRQNQRLTIELTDLRARLKVLQNELDEFEGKYVSVVNDLKVQETKNAILSERIEQLQRRRGRRARPQRDPDLTIPERPAQPLPEVPSPSDTGTHTPVLGLSRPVDRLRVFYPVDWVRLMTWLLLRPEGLARHNTTYGLSAYTQTALWLASTLVLLPFFVVFSALYFTPELSNAGVVAGDPFWMLLGVVAVWLLFAALDAVVDRLGLGLPSWLDVGFYIGYTTATKVVFGAGLGLLLCGLLIAATALDVMMGAILAVLVVVVVVMLAALAIDRGAFPEDFTDSIWYFLPPLVVALGILMESGDFLLGMGSGVLLAALWAGILHMTDHIADAIERPAATHIGKGLAVVLPLLYGVLIWVYWFGGWRTLHGLGM